MIRPSAPAEVPDRIACRVRQPWQLPADGLWHDDRLIAVLSGSPDEIGGQRQLKRGQEDDLAPGIEQLARVEVYVKPLSLVMLSAALIVLQVRYQGLDHLVFLAGEEN